MNQPLNKRSYLAWFTAVCWVLLFVLVVAQHSGPFTFVVLGLTSILMLYHVVVGARTILRSSNSSNEEA